MFFVNYVWRYYIKLSVPFFKLSCILSSIKSVSLSNESQYSVSLASFNETLRLLMKSALDCPNSDSRIIAPIEVPDLKTCFDNTNSLFSEANSG